MWLAARAAGLTRENAAGKKVLVHGASGGLGTLALQTLSAWGARVTAIAKASDFSACREAGAAEVVDRTENPFAGLRGAFDATLNFATWDDEAALLSCLREGALGHATTVHPLLQRPKVMGQMELLRIQLTAESMVVRMSPSGVGLPKVRSLTPKWAMPSET